MVASRTQFRVLVVGAGSIGERHIRCFQKTNRAIVGVVDTNSQLCMDIANRYGLTHAYVSLALAGQMHWDAAVIATPAPTHIPIAESLASVGTHLLIEKPISTTLDGIEELAQLIDRKGLVAAVAYTQRANPVIQKLRELLQSRRLGSPLQLIVVAGQHFPTFRPAYREIYFANRASGGGAVQDALPHYLNAGEWLLGPITRVTADAGHLALEGVNVEDTVSVIARHGAVMGSYSLNQHQCPNEITFTVVCEHGTIRAELHESRVRVMTSINGTWEDESCPLRDRDELYVRQANSFLDAIETDSPVLCTLDEASRTLCVVQEILQCLDGRQLNVIDYQGKLAAGLGSPVASV